MNGKPNEAAAHTAGPWSAMQTHAQLASGKQGHKSQWTVGIGRPSDLAFGVRGNEYMLVSGLCRESDAHLIAAAPDMLAALIVARSFVSTDRHALHDTCVRHDGTMDPDDQACVNDYDAALQQRNSAILLAQQGGAA
jgi:hypothetical protein